MAKVSARVDRPDGTYVEVKLEDNGIGCDAVKNDGIYSAYFADYTTIGRYNVLVSAVNDEGAKLGSSYISKKYKNVNKNHKTISSVNKTFSIDDFSQVVFFSNNNENSASIPVPAFSRVQNAGAFNLKSLPVYDTTPPIRVTDLSIASIDENSNTIDLIWTSAGDDLTVGTAKEVQIRADPDLAKLQDDSNFDSLYLFTDQKVIIGIKNEN